MKRLILILLILGTGCEKSRDERRGPVVEEDDPVEMIASSYNALDGCTRVSTIDQEKAFRLENQKWGGRLSRIKTPESDLWLEPEYEKLPKTMNFIRSIIGSYFTSLDECRRNTIKRTRFNMPEDDSEIRKVKNWYRPKIHRYSCKRKPLTLSEIESWGLRNLGFNPKSGICTLKVSKSNLGRLLIVNCDENVSYFTDTESGCKFILSEMKKTIEPELLQQFGWGS